MSLPRPVLWALVATIGLLPFVGAWPFVWRTVEWATYDSKIHVMAPAIDVWQQALLWGLVLLVVAGIVWTADRWLAAAVALGLVEVFSPVTYQDTIIFALAALVVFACRWAPRALNTWALRSLSLSGLAVALVVVSQWLSVRRGQPGWVGVLAQYLGFDPFYGGAWANPRPPGPFVTAGIAAGYVAVTGLLLPTLALPIIAAAVWMTGSLAAAVAFLVGLALRARSKLLAVTLVGGAGLLTYQHGLGSLYVRSCVLHARLWRMLFDAQTFGFGLGAWTHDPFYAPGTCAWDGPGVWESAHHEPAQWLYDRGVAGLIVLLGWMTTQKSRLLHPVLGPAFAALALYALAWPALHTIALGVVALTLVGVPADGPPSLWTGA